MRISVSSWATTEEDVERSLEAMIRVAGETIALSPPLIVTEAQIDQIIDKVGRAIRAVA